MKTTTKTCGMCGVSKPYSQFYVSRTGGGDGYMWRCKKCGQDYNREYILPALRGRGKARALPDWVNSMITKPSIIERKVIRLDEYTNKDHVTEIHAVVASAGGKR